MSLSRTLVVCLLGLFLAGCGSSDSSFDNGNARLLTAIAVAPAELKMGLGQSAQLSAIGTYNDGTDEDITERVAWTSSNETVAPVSAAGEVTALATGDAIATASLDGLSGESSVRVVESVTVELQILPPNAEIALDGTQRYQAFAVSSDGKVENVTFSADWRLEDESGIIRPYEPPAARDIDDFGTVIGVALGEDTLLADFNGLQSQSPVKVVPSELKQIVLSPFDEVIYAGGSLAYQLTGIYSNGTRADLTRQADYSSSDPAVATVSNASADRGVASGLAAGVAEISASVGELRAATTLTVIAAPDEVVRIDVLPASAMIGVSERLQYQAIAVTARGRSIDISGDAAWQSGNPDIAGIGAGTGLATGLSTGVTSITAVFQGVAGDARLEVVTGAPKLESISVEPIRPALPRLITQQFAAVGLYSDGSKRDLTPSALWQSSDKSVLVFSNLTEVGVGLAFTDTPGTAVASATFDGVTGSTEVTVLEDINPDAAILVTPALAQIATGTGLTYQAELSIPGLPAIDVTANVTWTSSDESVAVVDATGGARGLTGGTSTISATLAGEVDVRTARAEVLVGTAQLVVKDEPVVIERLTISPPGANLQVDESRQFQAVAELSDGSTQDATSSASWVTDDPQIAQVDTSGLVRANTAGETVLYARLIEDSKTIEASAVISVSAPELVSVSVTPPIATTLTGASIAFTAVAAYADGSTEDITGRAAWASSDPAIASVDSSGSALGIAAGTASISASLPGDNGPVTGSASLTVQQPVPDREPVGILVEPDVARVVAGETRSFTATLLFSDGSEQVVTGSSSWQSSDPEVAAVSGSGLATGVSSGTASIEAQFTTDGRVFRDSALLTVEDPLTLTGLRIAPTGAQIRVGTTQQFRAFAQISDGTEREVTADTSWFADPPEVAQVAPSGLATGLAAGAATVRAQFSYDDMSVSAQVGLVVLPPPFQIQELEVSPAQASLLPGQSQQYQAEVFLSDGSSQDVTGDVNWQSSQPGVAAIAPGGKAAAVTPGSTSITATLFYGQGEQIAGSASLQVDAIELVAIEVYPENASLPVGRDQAFVAVGRFNDESSRELVDGVNWTSTEPSILAIDTHGMATARAVGSAQVIATADGIEGGTDVTVTDRVIDDLQITPPTIADPAITEGPLVATAHYSDQTTDDVTQLAEWQSADPRIADVRNKPPQKGIYILLEPGETQISASYEGFTDTIPVRVDAPELRGILISPTNPEGPVGSELQFIARGVFSNATFPDLTDDVIWRSSNPAVASIEANTGFALARASGETTITATYAGFSAKTLLRVSPAVPVKLTVTPPNFEDSAGTSKSFRASMLFSDDSQREFTSEVTWTSDTPTVALVGNGGPGACETTVRAGLPSGCVSLLTPGSARITATYGTLSDSSLVIVNEPVVVDLFVDPYGEVYPDGLLVNFRATATYDNSGSKNVTADAVWHSLDGDVITADPAIPGQFYTVAEGSAEVTATYAGLTESVPVTVRPAQAISLQVRPGNVSEPAGNSVQLEADAFYDNGTAEPVTDQSVWQSALESVATIDTDGPNQGRLQLVAAGTTTVTAEFAGLSQTVPVTVTAATLESIQVQPASTEIALGSTLQYEAVGLYSDDSSAALPGAAWQSSATAIATIDTDGLAHSKALGETQISATYQGITGTTPLTVVDATVAALRIEPISNTGPAGTLSPVRAVATLTNNDSLDVTGEVTWGSLSGFIATVSADPAANEALVSYNNAGVTEITATLGSGASQIVARASVETIAALLERIELDPDPLSLPEGETNPVFATGFYSDNTTRLLNSTVDWTATDPSVATVDSLGLVTGLVANQQTQVRATLGDISGSAVVNVLDAQLESIQITPGALVEPKGTSGNLRADGRFSNGEVRDITNRVSWVSEQPAIAAVATGGENAGLLRLLEVGETVVSATLDGISEQINVRVTAAELVAILVTPSSPDIPLGLEQPFNAEGQFSDGSFSPINSDVTWTSSDPSIADITASGVATGRKAGTVTISAIEGNVVGTASLFVTEAETIALQVTPAGLVEPAGTSGRLSANATLSDGSSNLVTQRASWSSSDSAVVSVSNAPDAGVATLKAPGMATVTARYQGIEDSVTVTVTDAVLTAIRVLPSQETAAQGIQVQYRAEGVFSDGTVTAIDNDVSWTSSNTDIATISSTGLADTQAEGTAEIRAVISEFPDVVGTASLTVTQTAIEFMSLSPAAAQTVLVGQSRRYQAKVTLTDGTVQDVTAQSVWSVAPPSVASVDEAGLIRGLATGQAVVTAQYDDERGLLSARTISSAQGDLTVQPAEIVAVEINTFRDPGQALAIPAGGEEQWQAFANFSDGSFTQITDDAGWLSSDNDVATVVNGTVVAISPGITDISISYCEQGAAVRSSSCSEPLTDTVRLEVTVASLLSIVVSPSTNSVVAGSTVGYTAIGQYADGNDQNLTDTASWNTGNTAVASYEGVTSNARILGKAEGVTSVTASQDGISGSAEVIVDAAVPISLRIANPAPPVVVGSTWQYQAVAQFEDGSESDVTVDSTWESSNIGIAVVDQGQTQTIGIGSSSITANFQGLSITTELEVVSNECQASNPNGRPDSMIVLPDAPVLDDIGSQVQMQALGIYNPGEVDECSGSITIDPQTLWRVTGQSGRTIEVNGAGLVTAKKCGSGQVEASHRGVMGQATVTVCP